MSSETPSHNPEDAEASTEEEIINTESEDYSDEPEIELTQEEANTKSSALRERLKEFGSGFAEAGSKDVEGIKKVPEKIKNLFKKETWRGAFGAIRKDPGLLMPAVLISAYYTRHYRPHF